MRSASQRKSSSGRSAKTENLRTSSMMCWTSALLSVSVISHRAQVLMHELHRVGAFGDSGSHPLYGTVPNISRDEHSWNAGFQQPRVAIEWPARRPLAVRHQVWPGQNKSLFFTQQDARKPFGSRSGADEDEEMIRRNLLRLAACRALDRNRLQSLVAENFHNLAVPFDVNILRLANLIDQVLRHPRFQGFSTHQHNHPPSVLREKHRCLSRRVRPTNDVDVLALARGRFGHRRAVIDT